MLTAPEIVAAMREAVPAGLRRLGGAEVRCLRDLTRALASSKPDAPHEYRRFLAIAEREIGVPGSALQAWLPGRSVLVTGGTGCIGSALMGQLAAWSPRRLVSVSRGYTQTARLSGAEYVRADIRDPCRLMAIFRDVRPDVVFHVAAQRDPGLAEREVHRTATTNVFGTRNVIAAAAAFDVPRLISAFDRQGAASLLARRLHRFQAGR